MLPLTLSTVLQVVIALGLINVWLLRSRSATAYRGGAATTLKTEFDEYGLPGWFFYTIGVLKLGSAALLLVGLWVPGLVLPAAALVTGLMIGAISMHLKVKDPVVKYMPATIMLLLSLILVASSMG